MERKNPAEDESIYFDSLPIDPATKEVDFRFYCFSTHEYDPYTGKHVNDSGVEQPKKTKQFRKNTRVYSTFVEMVERKGWINNGVMPKTDDDDDLNRFMHENEFHRSQLQTKFRDLMKQYRDTSEVDKDIKDSHIYQNLIRRADGATTKDLLSIIIKNLYILNQRNISSLTQTLLENYSISIL